MQGSRGEFDLIRRHFTRPARRAVLGVGDDCALLDTPPGMQLAVSTDMLVEGRHFFPGTDPVDLGHKALAVNLSDLAAMGAEPLAFTLALALPEADDTWLAGFARGLFALADSAGIELVGGDTTRGPLNLCLTVMGTVPAGAALRRDGARAGDDIWVSGTPGDARLALGALRGEWELGPHDRAEVLPRLHRPSPRLALGAALRGIAHAAIDISDGLLGDLGHILESSGVGAALNVDAIPAGAAVAAQPRERRRSCQLAGGDDYELLFTAPTRGAAAVEAAAAASGCPVARVGRVTSAPGLTLLGAEGESLDETYPSFDHFLSP